jgi:hypothetical protein
VCLPPRISNVGFSQEQPFSVPSPAGLITIFYCLMTLGIVKQLSRPLDADDSELIKKKCLNIKENRSITNIREECSRDERGCTVCFKIGVSVKSVYMGDLFHRFCVLPK